VPNSRIIGKLCIGNNVNRSCQGYPEVVSRGLSAETEKNNEQTVRIAGHVVDILTRDIPNTKQE
jgi:hypothetical protein